MNSQYSAQLSSSNMSLRHYYCNCRLKTRLIMISATILLVSIGLLYRALSSHDTWENHGSAELSFPREHHRGYRLHSKMDVNDQDKNQRLKEDVAGLALPPEFHSIHDRDLLSAEAKEAAASFLSKLYPTNWKSATETDELALDLKHLLADYGLSGKLGCRDIDNMKINGPLTFSKTKSVDLVVKDENSRDYSSDDQGGRNGMRVINDGQSMAVKTFNGDSDTKIACMKEIYDPDYCEAMGNYRLLREILLLSTLQHPGIIALKGVCLRGNRIVGQLQNKGLAVITEVGVPLTQSLTHGSTWSQQLGMALQISRLLMYLDLSPVGSLRFKKLDLKDFVLVQNKDVKLADFDDLELGERSCFRSSDCQHLTKQFPCSSGKCKGLNSYINLDLAVKHVLRLILSRPPPANNDASREFLSQLARMEIDSMAAMTAELQMLFSQVPAQLVRIDNSAHQDGQESGLTHGADSSNDVLVQHQKEKEPLFSESALNQFDRYSKTNFPGIFDYPCPGSRVTWGCFHTVSSLREAATICVSDPQCQCFITFSTKPESETLMTVVMKNSADMKEARSSSGTTLFIRNTGHDNDDNNNNNVKGPLADREQDNQLHDKDQSQNHDAGKDRIMPVAGRGVEHDAGFFREETFEGQAVKKDDKDDKVLPDTSECLDDLMESLASDRLAREKKLMTHLGLKGVKEHAWRRSAHRQHLHGYNNLVKSNGGGGQFTVNLTQHAAAALNGKEVARRAAFIAEDGPKVYHMAYAVVYQLDRILGLFHTPPCISKKLSHNDVAQYMGNASWYEMFKPLLRSNGTLSGILVPPTPTAMKVSKLTLKPLESLTPFIKRFERQQRFQLEYMILWWLGRMEKTYTDHLGYKGHLIHFNADLAFSNTSLDLSGYLNHCQFPKCVYKSLDCFRCREYDLPGNDDTKVCALGEEVALRTLAMFPNELELNFQELQEDDITISIDVVASSILALVDSCIHKHGREAVLY
ncbi:extracellular tyrosine-protein kinase pkdcc-like [Plakobranchus ocellatus]|uniref:Extracellular tyrosine-protein kinase pkdcc-like n=1 Tax=Plakobranchus ocellatus TaxID=259542 RepID=A0AAV4BXG4_9GAST|nr:extracellular tyrosine-protein kinase pkdcc-like [Plakobranchus ocellatus]